MAAQQPTARSWAQLCHNADEDFYRESLSPVVYEFSNGRKFRSRVDPYGPDSFVFGSSLLDDPRWVLR